MRVLHVISSLDPQAGGPTAALIGLASAQVRAGMDVKILATWKNPDDQGVAERLRQVGVGVHHVGPARGPLARHPDLPVAARNGVANADLVHIHALWEEVQHQAAVAARRQGTPYIFRPCGMLDPWSLAQSRWKKKLYLAWRLRRDLDGAAAIHFTSDAERDLAAALRLAPPAIVEPNGLDLAQFAQLPPLGTFRAQFPVSAGTRLILFLSRLHYKKGLDLLIPAFARIVAAKPGQFMLVLAGPDGGYRAQVQKMIVQHRLEDQVLMTGMLEGEKKVAALAEAELFVLPSYQENFGIVVIEALAAGTPVIISDGVNIGAEIAAAGVGAVVSVRGSAAQNVDALAQTLERWLGDADLRKQAASRARAYVWERYDWEHLAARWGEHYRQIKGKR